MLLFESGNNTHRQLYDYRTGRLTERFNTMEQELDAIIAKLLRQFEAGLITEPEFWSEVREQTYLERF